MKKIFNAIGKKTRDAKFQQRAVKKMEDIEKGEKIPAPRYPTEDKRYQEAQADDSIREVGALPSCSRRLYALMGV